MTINLQILEDDDDDYTKKDGDGDGQDNPFQTGQSGLPAFPPPLKMLKTMIFTPRKATQTQPSTLMLVSCPSRLSSISTYQEQRNIARRCATLTLT